jgi:hypothetical protein
MYYTMPPSGTYAPPRSPAAGALAYQPPAQHRPRPAPSYSRNAVASDRLPAMPEMLQRPAPQQARPPIIRGAAPEETAARQPVPPRPVAQVDWKPIRIPTPSQLGIPANEPTQVATLPVATAALPERYDLATVTAWLDSQGVRSCQRERLAEGVRYACTFASAGQPEQTLSARGATDEDALKGLVQEVLRNRPANTLSMK